MNVVIRPATKNDALHVAAVVDIAGHGIDLDSWIKNSGGDHAVLEAARRAASADPGSPYHFSKAYLVEVEGVIAGGLVGELLGPVDDYGAEISPALMPLVTLETRLVGYWSILAIAVYAEYRGKGLAGRLLSHAGELAEAVRAKGLCLTVEDTNLDAISVYRRLGFAPAESLPWVPYGGRSGPNQWVMMKLDF
ncbi:GNAT family N-acetyltransferase [Mesorhizobium sp. M2D.F.Ca.ET.185.01.1.1]|uniref:GNAT family N-acetyltransferase n=2 Tax=Mesorhizobium TaxID=68287 RepID=UPI000FCC95D6|nr:MULTISPECIES: GNAT family N-acetyltransferase [unclassified Mesorhizobium]TGP51238.1 GNAT family N-acetyltransferase [bacterium M00.F.Ca.ET.230.01.1.1]TGP78033.1 GNAT family N-acetyltransferase [bacterium M00.F.Ca.ET.227.01.1.1]TGP88155.1 GNAT family N-acetyltransferase [bacterium M00.F.Ca.ET.221.01.1.1]TGP93370.1 GNAT family N-acetyltransferase [bacterium M00.F.Ca.ET.222.01.1.1]TGT72607.1 GNAT family N-acetyltransferase [bacterium M00.F.Ca.ET.159.01.1.1]TGT85776.1 GNAT family N-acetyltran